MNQLVAYGAYPSVLVFGMGFHLFMMHKGWDLQMATYLPIIIGAMIVIGLEFYFPHRQVWKADKKEILQDTIFMTCIQGVLPKILSFAIAVTLLQNLRTHHLTMNGWWPIHWPVPFQMLLMMVVADGLRYWLHRISHEWEPLWRFHAVHHAPHKLYWLNVGRFHPIDKGLQFLFDVLPFILLGVGEEVLGLYLVCYALNGFFQHSNIEVRLGVLNYVISGPELHRWHHSRFKEESNHNYGNNLIIWDWLFGTWYLPEDKHVDELGLVNRRYPTSFLKQMMAPFIAGADKRTV